MAARKCSECNRYAVHAHEVENCENIDCPLWNLLLSVEQPVPVKNYKQASKRLRKKEVSG